MIAVHEVLINHAAVKDGVVIQIFALDRKNKKIIVILMMNANQTSAKVTNAKKNNQRQI